VKEEGLSKFEKLQMSEEEEYKRQWAIVGRIYG
jgi:hypothetical protein